MPDNKALQRTRISVGCFSWRSVRAAELGRQASDEARRRTVHGFCFRGVAIATPDKVLQLTVNPLRGLSAAELSR